MPGAVKLLDLDLRTVADQLEEGAAESPPARAEDQVAVDKSRVDIASSVGDRSVSPKQSAVGRGNSDNEAGSGHYSIIRAEHRCSQPADARARMAFGVDMEPAHLPLARSMTVSGRRIGPS